MTWDGLLIAPENPRASSVVVWRRRAAGREYLLLHRHHQGEDYAGDWAHVTDEVALFCAEVPADADVRLDPEHDEFAWLSLEEAAPRCLPAVVGESLRIVDAHLGQ
jgi:hypothetical protein